MLSQANKLNDDVKTIDCESPTKSKDKTFSLKIADVGFTGKVYSIDVTQNDDILTIKRQIQKKIGVEINRQRIMFFSRVVPDNIKLEEIGIIDDSRFITLVK